MGVPLERYHSLPGNRYWLSDDDPVCKADILAIYRTANTQAAVVEHIQRRNADKNG